jgi:transposase-like protein
MMARKRKKLYTDSEKKRMVARAFKLGSVTAVAEETGVTAGAIRFWCNDPKFGGKAHAFSRDKGANRLTQSVDQLPTVRRQSRKARALVPILFTCPHCGGQITKEA